MKTSLKTILLAVALGLWTSAAFAHHISGMIVCIDTVPVRPLAGVLVTATGAPGTFTATTGADGLFYIPLPTVTATYTVTIATPPGMTIVSPASGQYVAPIFLNGVGGPDAFAAAFFELRGCQGPPPVLGRIGDTVYCDANANGTQDAGEAGISGVTVTLVCRDSSGATIASATTTTDVNGKYLFINVPAGPCEVSVNPATVRAPCNVPVCALKVTQTLAAGETYLGADFCFTAAPPQLGRIGDTVYCDTNKNGRQDAGEPGLMGVSVKLVCKNAAGAVIASAMATTDANGKYLFIDVPAGKCEVSVDPSTLPCPCIVPVCALKVSRTLRAGEIFLSADFCFTTPTLIHDGEDDDDDDHDGEDDDDDHDDDHGDHGDGKGDKKKHSKE